MPTLTIREEVMAGHFTKFHIEGLPFAAVLHRFSQPDHGDFNDHPFAFTSTILAGGYAEEILDPATGEVTTRYRDVGETFVIKASHIHRIPRLLDGECWTLIQPRAWERDPGFYQQREDGLYHRFWHQPEFSRVEGDFK